MGQNNIPIPTLSMVPDDMEAHPELIKRLTNGQTIWFHFRTDDYYFEWVLDSKACSTIHLRQRGSQIGYSLFMGRPISKWGHDCQPADISPKEFEQVSIAMGFIHQVLCDPKPQA